MNRTTEMQGIIIFLFGISLAFVLFQTTTQASLKEISEMILKMRGL